MELIKRGSLKRILVVLGLLLMVWSLPLQAAPGQEEAPIRIGLDVQAPPYSYVDSNGLLKGFNVDVVRAVAIEKGLDVELYALSASDLEKQLLNDDLDAVVARTGLNLNGGVSRSIVESRDALFVRADNRSILDLEGFWNSRSAIHIQSLTPLITNYIHQHQAESVHVVADQEHGLLLLMNQEVDSYIGNRDSGLFLIQRWDQAEYLKVVGEAFNQDSFVFYTRPEDTVLAQELDLGLEALVRSESYEKIYVKWFGEKAESYEKQLRQLLAVLSLLALVGLILFSLGVRWNNALKKEVEKRTQELHQANAVLKTQQQELRDRERFKEDVLNSVPTGIMTFDRKGQLTSANSRALEILQGQPPTFVNQEKLRWVLSEGRCLTNLEQELVAQDQSKRLVYHVYPLRNGDGGVAGAIVSFKDVSRERKLAEEMARMDKMKSLDLLVSEFVHEIRTPLTSIKAMVELLPQKIDNPTFRRNLQEIVSMEVERLSHLVSALGEYARPMPGVMSPLKMRGVAEGALLLLQRKLQEKKVTWSIEVPETFEIEADQMQLMQVLINVILNSLEAVAREGRIWIKGWSTPEGEWVLSITDDGPGMSEEVRDKVTEPFYTTRKDGTGLGLYICKDLLAKNQGRMEILSEEGRGTEVRLYFEEKEQS